MRLIIRNISKYTTNIYSKQNLILIKYLNNIENDFFPLKFLFLGSKIIGNNEYEIFC
jgi:hypothetical protein